MELSINPDSILGGIEQLGSIKNSADNSVHTAMQSTINATFSGVSGLDQLGGGHGGVITGGPGSALSILKSYSEQVAWLRDALAASYEAITGQNAFVARGMDIADEGGSVGNDSVAFPPRPAPRFENFSFMPPMVLPAVSIDMLSAEFSSTKIQESVAAARTWKQLSAQVTGIAESLHAVAADLGGRNSGVVIEAAIDKIAEVGRAGETFAANASTMSTSVEQLAAIKSQGAVRVNSTKMALAAIVDPVQRLAAEQAFLQTFPLEFTPFVATGVPPIRNLMVMDPTADGGGTVALGMTDVEGKGSKHDATGLRAPGAAMEAVSAAQQAVGAGSFGTVQDGVGQLQSVGNGGMLQAGQVGTAAANSGTGLATSPTAISPMGANGAASALGGLGQGGAGFGAPVAGGLPGRGAAASGLNAAGLTGTRPGLGSLAGAGTSPTGTGSVPAMGPIGAAGSGAGAMAGGPGRPGGGVRGPGAIGGLGSGGAPIGGAGAAQAGNGGVATRMGTPGVAPTAAAGAGQARGTGGQMRGMPLMGAPMAGAQQAKASKVKTVTSAVEEDDNVAALLGERAAVVPGVIGAWARG